MSSIKAPHVPIFSSFEMAKAILVLLFVIDLAICLRRVSNNQHSVGEHDLPGSRSER